MKKNLLLALLTASMLAVTPAAFAKENAGAPKGGPESAEVAEKAEKSAPKAKDAPKNLTKEEHARLKAARDKADADPAVVAAWENEKAARKAFLDARKSGDEAKSVAAKKALDEAHAAAVKARHDVIAKADPEAGKLDDRVFAIGERLRKARENKFKNRKGNNSSEGDEKDAKDAPVSATENDKSPDVDGEPKGLAKSKGKGREHAPGQKKNKDKPGE